MIIPVSAVIATRNRADNLSRTLESLLSQEIVPAEFIVVDASDDDATKNLLAKLVERVGASVNVRWLPADTPGAARQRNQGVTYATQPFIWFFDDDILFEPNCVQRLWRAIEQDRQLGGVNAMIVNQQYHPPGVVSRTMFTLMHGRREKSFAGKVIGPAINLLPEDRPDLPEVVPVEWLNTTCTIYRREALPSPPFDSFFTGYSLMEDLALSLQVGLGLGFQRGASSAERERFGWERKKWKLANARTARIFHDSQSQLSDKSDASVTGAMELINRHHVLTKVLERKRFTDYLRLFFWEAFQLAVCGFRPDSRTDFAAILRGKWRAIQQIGRSHSQM